MNRFNLITPSGLAGFQSEKIRLLEKRKEAVINLRTAREMGDLSENAAYHVARRELSSIDSRLRYLEKIIRTAKVVVHTNTDTAGIGNKVRLQSENGTVEYLLVGGFESDPAKGRISHISPIGKALIGKKAGDEIRVATPKGVATYKIIAILG